MIHKLTMKGRGILVLLFFLYLNTSAQKAIISQSISYKLDTKQSKILWKGPKSVGNKHYGTLQLVSGVLYEDAKGKLTYGDFILNMNSIRSSDNKEAKKRKEVDDLLISNDFFAVVNFPTGQMKVKTILPTTQAAQFKVVGDLVLKGIKKQIEFLATIRKVNNTITIKGNLTIDRHVWGIDSKKKNDTSIFPDIRDKLIADEIPISLDLILRKH